MLITGDFIRNMHLGSQASRSPKSKIARIMAQLSHGREPIVPPHPPAQHPSRSWGCQFIADDGKCGEPRDGRSSYCRDHRALCCRPVDGT